MIYLTYLSDLSDLDHDLYDQSVRSIWCRSWSSWSIFRSIWSISWFILSICPLYLINIMIYLSDLSDIDHDTSGLFVRSIKYRSWSNWPICPTHLIQIVIYLIYLSDLSDLDHNPSNLSDPVYLNQYISNTYVRFIWSDLSVQSPWSRS